MHVVSFADGLVVVLFMFGCVHVADVDNRPEWSKMNKENCLRVGYSAIDLYAQRLLDGFAAKL